MLGVVMVLGFMFGFMLALGILGLLVERFAKDRANDIVREVRRKEENERRAG